MTWQELAAELVDGIKNDDPAEIADGPEANRLILAFIGLAQSKDAPKEYKHYVAKLVPDGEIGPATIDCFDWLNAYLLDN